MGDGYRTEDAAAAVARLRQDNAELQAQLDALGRRLDSVELRAGIARPGGRAGKKPSWVLVGLVVGAALFGVGAAVYMHRASASSDYLRSHPNSPTGVAACDLYISKWQSCYTDPAVRVGMQEGLDRIAKQWRSMAGDARLVADLEKSCANLVDQFPSSQCPASRPAPPSTRF